MLQQSVTAESPKGPDCQSRKMDWLIYVFANFSSESWAATRNSGLTLQTWNLLRCKWHFPLLICYFFYGCVPRMSQWDPQIGDRNTARVWRDQSAECKLVLQLCRKWALHNSYSQLCHPHAFILTWKAWACTEGKTSPWSLSGKWQQQHLLGQTSLGREQTKASKIPWHRSPDSC